MGNSESGCWGERDDKPTTKKKKNPRIGPSKEAKDKDDIKVSSLTDVGSPKDNSMVRASSVSKRSTMEQSTQKSSKFSNPYESENNYKMEREINLSKSVRISNGLPNMGNTCYMNSVLQCLFNSRAFINSLYINTSNGNVKALTKKFYNLAESIWASSSNDESVESSIRKFQKEIGGKFYGSDQQDAFEFLSVFLEKLGKEVNTAKYKNEKSEFKPRDEKADVRTIVKSPLELNIKAYEWDDFSNRKEQSYLRDVFEFMQVIQITCTKCKNKLYSFENSTCLSLDIPTRQDSLEDLLDNYTGEQAASDYTCAFCKKKVTVKINKSFWKLPDHLIIHLKKFKQEGPNRYVTNKQMITLPEKLKMNSYIQEESNHKNSATYHLTGIVRHYGSFNSGHYTAACWNDKWRSYDDSRVSSESFRDLSNCKEAYILFYTNTSSL